MKLKYFKISDFDCKHTGKNQMDPDFLTRLDNLREICGFPFIVVSGYRDKTHPAEARKANPGTGTHCLGLAADIWAESGVMRGSIVQNAIKLNFQGIGVANTFIHVDARQSEKLIMWSY